MAARFVWLGGWPQGLGPPVGRAEFLNLYGRPRRSGPWSFLGLFSSKKGGGLWGFGAWLLFGAWGLFGLLVRPFWAQKGGENLGFIPDPRHLFGAIFWPFGVQKWGHFGRFGPGAKKSWSGANFWQVGFFCAGLWSHFWAFGFFRPSARRVVFWTKKVLAISTFLAKTRYVEVVGVFSF